MKLTLIFCAVAMGTVVWPAEAREWPETAGWTIAETPDSCGMLLEYEGKGATELVVVLHHNGVVVLGVTNTGWSTEKGKTYEVTWKFAGASAYTGPGEGTGEQFASRKGFRSIFGSEVVADIEKASSLDIYRGDQVVDQLQLRGSSAAMAVVKRCLAGVRSKISAEQREKARFSHIPDNPFASAEPSSNGGGPVQRPGDIDRYFTEDNYPPTSRRENQQGDVRIKAVSGEDRRAVSCEVVGSSGHRDLDDATCRIIRSRYRFASPAKAGDYIEETVKWRLTSE